jgi:aspartate aminotransferase
MARKSLAEFDYLHQCKAWRPPRHPEARGTNCTAAYTSCVATFPRISRRIGAIAESATLKVDAKAKALQAEGRKVISYAAGEPDFSTPAYIVDAASAAVLDPKNYRYTPAVGLPDLREAIAAKTLRDSGLAVTAAQVVVTNGGKQAVYQSFATLLDAGDEVLLPAPYWTTYPEAIKLAGGVPVEVFAGSDQGYLVTVDQLEAARTERTKVLLFVSPSNPTGAVYSAEETRAIGEWALEHGIWVISDEIYQNLTYGASESDAAPRAVSIVEAVPALADTTILVNGVAKTYAMTGWRVGWMVGPLDVMKAAGNLQSHLSSNVSNISQRAALAALTGPQDAVEEMRRAFDRRRRLIVSELNAIEGIVCPMPEGAFYVYPDVTGLLNREWGGVTPTTSLELADLILEQAEVAVVPGEAFGPSGYLRLSYALGDEPLLEGVRRLQRLFA